MLNSGVQPAAAYFVNTNVTNKGNTLSGKPFLLDTGADISVVSEINAVNLGFDPRSIRPTSRKTFLVRAARSTRCLASTSIAHDSGRRRHDHAYARPVIVLDFPNPSHVGNKAEGSSA